MRERGVSGKVRGPTVVRTLQSTALIECFTSDSRQWKLIVQAAAVAVSESVDGEKRTNFWFTG